MSTKKLLIGGGVTAVILGGVIYGTMGGDKSQEMIDEENNEQVQVAVEKQDFLVETKLGEEFGGNAFLDKTGKVISQEDISISAQANGKISSIAVKEGQKIATGQKLITLTDSIGAYGLNLKKTQLGVESAQIDYSTQQINLDKSVSDATIALEKIKNESQSTRQSLTQNLAQAELALEKSKTDLEDTKKLLEQGIAQSALALGSSKNVSEDTTLALQIQKLNNSIAKSQIDVDNMKKSNVEQLKTFKNSAISTYNTLNDLIIDIVDFSDQILGVTQLNKKLNDDYEQYLGKKNTVQLSNTEALFREFTTFKENNFDTLELENKNFEDLTLEEYEAIFLVGDKGYDLAEKLLKEMSKVFDNTIISVGSISQAEVSAYKTQVNGYESQTSGLFTAYLGFKGQVRTFLNTYKDSEFAADENLKLLQDEVVILQKSETISGTDFDVALKNNEINFERTKIDNDKTITSLENAVKNNEINLAKLKIDNQKALVDLDISLKEANIRFENAKQVRAVTLKKMNNNIDISVNSKDQAAKEYAKLSSTSPIYGVVTEILIDEGQDVNIGSPLMTISSLENTEVEISLSEEERGIVTVGTEVFVEFKGKKIIGKIESVSAVANDNLSYKTKVSFSEKFDTIGGLIDISIPVKTESILFPINIIEVTGEGKGKVNVLSGSTIQSKGVELGKVWGDTIEIISEIEPETKIITTNLSNYDSNRFIIKTKNEETELDEEESEVDKQKD